MLIILHSTKSKDSQFDTWKFLSFFLLFITPTGHIFWHPIRHYTSFPTRKCLLGIIKMKCYPFLGPKSYKLGLKKLAINGKYCTRPNSRTVSCIHFQRGTGLDPASSGAGTNLKVGGRGAPIRRKVPEKILVVPSHFSALKAQLVVLVSAFMMVSTVWYVFCLLFFYSRCPPCPAICKSGGHVPPRALWSRRHCPRGTSNGMTQRWQS